MTVLCRLLVSSHFEAMSSPSTVCSCGPCSSHAEASVTGIGTEARQPSWSVAGLVFFCHSQEPVLHYSIKSHSAGRCSQQRHRPSTATSHLCGQESYCRQVAPPSPRLDTPGLASSPWRKLSTGCFPSSSAVCPYTNLPPTSEAALALALAVLVTLPFPEDAERWPACLELSCSPVPRHRV